MSYLQPLDTDFRVRNTNTVANHAKFRGKTKDMDYVDVETEHGIERFEIPATHLSNYWAIMKVMYLNANKPVSMDKLCDQVEKLMEEEGDFAAWTRFKNKSTVKTTINVDVDGIPMKKVIEKKAQPWRSRLVKNARNLCRIGGSAAYGTRLLERGHVLRFETTADGESAFTLYTYLDERNTKELRRGRKRRA
jgi:hypothetical protein